MCVGRLQGAARPPKGAWGRQRLLGAGPKSTARPRAPNREAPSSRCGVGVGFPAVTSSSTRSFRGAEAAAPAAIARGGGCQALGGHKAGVGAFRQETSPCPSSPSRSAAPHTPQSTRDEMSSVRGAELGWSQLANGLGLLGSQGLALGSRWSPVQGPGRGKIIRAVRSAPNWRKQLKFGKKQPCS